MSNINQLFNKKAIILNLKATTKKDALIEIADVLKENDFIKSKATFVKALNDREAQFSTGLGEEIAIPHAQSSTVTKNVVLIARSKKGIDWDSVDKKPVKVLFSIALNDENKDQQVEVLQQLSSIMMDKEVIEGIKKATSAAEILESLIIKKEVKVAKKTAGAKTIVAVTACPTGIAHTYMSAKAIEAAAQEMGFNFKVETQGRTVDNSLTDSDISKADAIILAIDKGIDGMERFNGKKVLKIGTKAAIKDAKKLITDALNGQGETIKVSAKAESSNAGGEISWNAFKDIYKNLMGGVSRMLPFVVAGGIILGIAFLLDSGITGGNLGVTRDVSRWFAGLGKTAFSIFVPVLGGYVSYSIVGSEGLLPGFIAGLIASGGGILYGGPASSWSNLWGGLTPGIDQGVLSAGSGFIGAMIGGYIAAASVMVLRKYVFHKVSENFRGVVGIVAVPVMSVLMTGVAMFAFQIPLAYFSYGLKLGLQGLADNNLIWLLTALIGLMMASDMGGPINKVAYTFGTGLIGASGAGAVDYQIMGAVMIGGMVPPMAIALATLIWRDKAFTKGDQSAGIANWLMGAFFITEGAIPFAAKDPKRVIPCIMAGSMVAGLMMGLLEVGVSAPHGGVLVFALMRSYLFDSTSLQIGMGVLFALASIAAGVAVGGLSYGFWKSASIKSGKAVIA